QMPQVVGLVIFVLLILAFVAIVLRRRAYGPALAAPLAAVLVGSVAAWLATVVMGVLRAGSSYWHAYPEPSFVATYATALFGAVAVLVTLGATLSRDQLRAGAWLIFLLFGAILAAAAPGAIIYF